MGEDLGFQPGQAFPDRLLQRAEIFLMDDDVLGVSLVMICRAKGGKILVMNVLNLLCKYGADISYVSPNTKRTVRDFYLGGSLSKLLSQI